MSRALFVLALGLIAAAEAEPAERLKTDFEAACPAALVLPASAVSSAPAWWDAILANPTLRLDCMPEAMSRIPGETAMSSITSRSPQCPLRVLPRISATRAADNESAG
jgi:hypothetical protein